MSLKTASPKRHHRSQLHHLKKALPLIPGGRLLDYGCGNGLYIANAQRLGLDAVGVEFSEAVVARLRQQTGLDIVTRERLHRQNAIFDVIHLGHVLEHLPQPDAALRDLRHFAHDATVWLFDGPLEKNFCLTRLTIVCGTLLQNMLHPGRLNQFIPQHLWITDHRSQLRFFQRLGFRTLRYCVDEQHWPFPDRFGGSLSGRLRYLVATSSIALSSLRPRWGNLFHYAATWDSPR